MTSKQLSTPCPLGCWLLSTAAENDCALATIGFSKLGPGFRGALSPSPCPLAMRRQRLQEPRPLLFVPRRASSRWVRRQLPRQLAVWPRVCPACPPLNLTPRVLTTANVESCELQRRSLSCQRGVHCLSVIVPTTNHTHKCFSTS